MQTSIGIHIAENTDSKLCCREKLDDYFRGRQNL